MVGGVKLIVVTVHQVCCSCLIDGRESLMGQVPVRVMRKYSKPLLILVLLMMVLMMIMKYLRLL